MKLNLIIVLVGLSFACSKNEEPNEMRKSSEPNTIVLDSELDYEEVVYKMVTPAMESQETLILYFGKEKLNIEVINRHGLMIEESKDFSAKEFDELKELVKDYLNNGVMQNSDSGEKGTSSFSVRLNYKSNKNYGVSWNDRNKETKEMKALVAYMHKKLNVGFNKR